MKSVLSVLTGIALLWVLGFAVFVWRLPAPTTENPKLADGVVVFTGGGGARISAAMSVFSDGAGERLLISGVHPDTSLARLSELWRGEADRFSCCVDLGHEALSTEGNANELAAWATSNKFSSIILVTSDYHMPRAIIATRAKMKNAIITPHPVASGYLDAKGRPASIKATGNLAGEYSKFLLAYAAALFA
ncbi:YdcF family protein [Hyphococcus flavus]|uniref:YdcF family protein n=1 Tax=Hyphococcus flavus TaxID=1866326 RepID=A0AAF0CIP0_9PROT|nr:YdcF family protein [Hyphococcus flavus]WDI33057.1 YdcF family protein [Hyphococcus flavus]